MKSYLIALTAISTLLLYVTAGISDVASFEPDSQDDILKRIEYLEKEHISFDSALRTQTMIFGAILTIALGLFSLFNYTAALEKIKGFRNLVDQSITNQSKKIDSVRKEFSSLKKELKELDASTNLHLAHTMVLNKELDIALASALASTKTFMELGNSDVAITTLQNVIENLQRKDIRPQELENIRKIYGLLIQYFADIAAFDNGETRVLVAECIALLVALKDSGSQESEAT